MQSMWADAPPGAVKTARLPASTGSLQQLPSGLYEGHAACHKMLLTAQIMSLSSPRCIVITADAPLHCPIFCTASIVFFSQLLNTRTHVHARVTDAHCKAAYMTKGGSAWSLPVQEPEGAAAAAAAGPDRGADRAGHGVPARVQRGALRSEAGQPAVGRAAAAARLCGAGLGALRQGGRLRPVQGEAAELCVGRARPAGNAAFHGAGAGERPRPRH